MQPQTCIADMQKITAKKEHLRSIQIDIKTRNNTFMYIQLTNPLKSLYHMYKQIQNEDIHMHPYT